MREEKMRKRVKVQKPKIEAELLKVIPAWEEEHGEPIRFSILITPEPVSAELVALITQQMEQLGIEVDVGLHWQQWRLRSPALDAVAAAVVAAAHRYLRR